MSGGNVFENGRVEVKKKKTKNRPDVVGPETDNKAYTSVLSWIRVTQNTSRSECMENSLGRNYGKKYIYIYRAFPKSRKASHENAWAGHLPT